MNNFLLFTLASVIAVTCSTALTASPDLTGLEKAHLPPPPPPAPLLPPPHKKIEHLKHILLVRDLLLHKYDTNRNGKLDATEKETLLRDAEQEKKNARKAFLKRYDLDGDGKLSKEERDALRAQMKKRHKHVSPAPPPPQGKPSGPRPKEFGSHPHMVMENKKNEKFIVRPSVFMLELALLLKKYDANGNGIIDHKESEKIRKDADTLYVCQIQKLLATYDKNDDGTLSDEEKIAITHKKSTGDTASEQNDELDDIDLFIQASFDEELLDSLEEE